MIDVVRNRNLDARNARSTYIYTHTHIFWRALVPLSLSHTNFRFVERIPLPSHDTTSHRRRFVTGDLTSSMQVSRNGPRAPRTRNRLQMLKAAAPGTLPLPDTGETN